MCTLRTLELARENRFGERVKGGVGRKEDKRVLNVEFNREKYQLSRWEKGTAETTAHLKAGMPGPPCI